MSVQKRKWRQCLSKWLLKILTESAVTRCAGKSFHKFTIRNPRTSLWLRSCSLFRSLKLCPRVTTPPVGWLSGPISRELSTVLYYHADTWKFLWHRHEAYDMIKMAIRTIFMLQSCFLCTAFSITRLPCLVLSCTIFSRPPCGVSR